MNRTAGRYYPFSHYLMFPAVMVSRPELLKKINPDLLPEQVKTLFDDLYAKYKDQLSK